MKWKTTLKIIIDIVMTILLMLLMPFELIGRAAHEWIGVGMFVLVIIHHILNRSWEKNIFKGKYSPYRIMQLTLVFLVFLSMAGSMFSGILISRVVFASLPIRGGYAFARNLHMISAYWGFVVMSLHLGLHWSIMTGIARKFVKKSSAVRNWGLRGIAILIAGYGVYAFFKRDIGSYMLLKNPFVFFDFDEPLFFFMIDYVAVMGLFVCIGHYIAKGLRRIPGKN